MKRLVLPLSFALTLAPAVARADVVTEWNRVTIDALKAGAVGANAGPRALAIVHLAMHDAVSAITGAYEPYHARLGPAAGASVDAAVATAAHDALVALVPSQRDAADAALATTLATVPDPVARDEGIRIGAAAAGDLLALRANDGSNGTGTYEKPDVLGAWEPTPPKLLPAAQPFWRYVTPFVLQNPSEVRAPAPPPLTSERYGRDVEEERAIGGLQSTTRTEEQTQIAKFWLNPTHYPLNAMTRSIAEESGRNVADNARLFALVNAAMADARVAGWDTKYTYPLWRPVTAIPRGDEDGNPITIAQPDWQPLVETPNHPDYVSGHAITGAAGATVLVALTGDRHTFTVPSDSLPGVTRSFDSVSAAARENGLSRIYAGIHYRFSVDVGFGQGVVIGRKAVERVLRPTSCLPRR